MYDLLAEVLESIVLCKHDMQIFSENAVKCGLSSLDTQPYFRELSRWLILKDHKDLVSCLLHHNWTATFKFVDNYFHIQWIWNIIFAENWMRYTNRGNQSFPIFIVMFEKKDALYGMFKNLEPIV